MKASEVGRKERREKGMVRASKVIKKGNK